jgi:aspartate aminotransferase-like enzyme
VLVASAGYFGERWAAIASAYGLESEWLRYGWGEALQAEEIAERIELLGDVRAVYVTHSETSTGVVNDVQAIAERSPARERFSSSMRSRAWEPVPLERTPGEIDVVVAGSQKALMTPPGLALLRDLGPGVGAFGDGAVAAVRRSTGDARKRSARPRP